MGAFIAVVAFATAIFLAAVYAPLLRFLGPCSPLHFVRRAGGTYAMGFGSTSSVASYPVMLRDPQALGVPEPVAGLVLSLGAAMNRAGTAVFEGTAVVFLAHVYAVPLSAAALASAFVATFFVAMPVAPVPSAGVVILAPALEAMALLLGIDRIPDMFRSATNITGTWRLRWWSVRSSKASPEPARDRPRIRKGAHRESDPLPAHPPGPPPHPPGAVAAPHRGARGPEIWIKRDDCTGLATGGNKTRKLEFLTAEACAEGADLVRTQGATQSNHARQTATAVARLGLAVDHFVTATGSAGTQAGLVAGFDALSAGIPAPASQRCERALRARGPGASPPAPGANEEGSKRRGSAVPRPGPASNSSPRWVNF